jgi:short-subunit dehydrogenase
MVISFLVLLRKALRVMGSLYSTTLKRGVDFKRSYGPNSWALITGSSDGIGKGIALSLAKEGVSIILSARTDSKLHGLKNEIKSLSYEYAGKIDILSLNPSEVCTPMTFHKKNIFTISPEQCVEGLLNELGHGTKASNGH